MCANSFICFYLRFLLYSILFFFILYHPHAAGRFYSASARYLAITVARPHSFFYFIILFRLMLYIDCVYKKTQISLTAKQTPAPRDYLFIFVQCRRIQMIAHRRDNVISTAIKYSTAMRLLFSFIAGRGAPVFLR